MRRLSLLLLAAPSLLLGQTRPSCVDNAGIKVPTGFCATIFADSVDGARHMVVAPNGDLFVSTQGQTGGGVVGLRDTKGTGHADLREQFATGFNSSEVALYNGYLYAENITGILRFPYKEGSLMNGGPADTVVAGLPTGGHRNKTFTIARDGSLYVNIGSLTNACQPPEKDRAANVPGENPCTQRDTRAGIWKWDAKKLHQSYADGEHFAQGIRNAVGISMNPMDGKLWSMQHGRDQLSDWKLPGMDVKYNAENPAEELLQINKGDDFGWPYCYYAVAEHKLVLAPEYGGDGKKVEQCAQKKEPIATFPGHWAPNALFFYTGSNFPAKYKNGAFIAFHGSWNRAPEPQAGFNVVFQPLSGEKATGPYEVFADGFFTNLTAARANRASGAHRPTGFAQGRDGALYVADDAMGRIYKIVYVGSR